MTKNQVTYLLALATLGVFWLFFNTFFMASKMDQKMNLASGMGRPMMGDSSQRQPFAMSVFPKGQGKTSMNQPSAMPSDPSVAPPALQKMLEAQKQKAKGAVPAEKK